MEPSQYQYAYTKDLLVLDSRKSEVKLNDIPAELREVRTPLVVEEWEKSLRGHPDREFCAYLLRGMAEGFRVGFQYNHSCTAAKSNMKSASDYPEVVDDYLRKEREAGCVIGPVDAKSLPPVQVSRFGVIPKSQPGKWRLIVDLSHPAGSSVNDGIEPELCTLKYTSVDEAVRRLVAMGPGALLAKLDVERAYRIVPVHPTDRLLLGMQWRGELYIDTALPFGLRSAPKIFSALADALLWIFNSHGIKAIHYLDDFLLFGEPHSSECSQALSKALAICARLGIPVAVQKTEGPTCVLVFLGIELDTSAGTLRLPQAKLSRLQEEIQRWLGRRVCTKRELLSLIGQLQHACCVVRPGRSFLRRMIGLAKVARELHHRIRLNKDFRSDLQWWACFLPDWNGISMMSGLSQYRYSGTITSDASGTWGCGAYSSAGDWFQLEWPSSWKGVHITVQELLPVVLAVALWGKQWQGKSIRCRCDNAAAVAIVNSGSSKDDRAMHLMRSLFFFLAKYNVTLRAEHIPGSENGAADALSRNNRLSFLSQVPSARGTPTQISPGLLQVLVHKQPDWTSRSWTVLLRDIL